LMAVGAISIILGVTLLSPLVVGAITAVLGWPLHRAAGVAGSMAQKNATRNPRRTATTAAALMIGLALVSTALVVGQSIKTTLGTTIEESTKADYFVTDQLEEVTFPTSLAAELDQSPAVDAVSGFRYVEARVGSSVSDVAAADLEVMDQLLDIDVREGGYPTDTDAAVLVSADEATSSGIGVGDQITAEFSNGSTTTAVVAGVFHDQAIVVEDYLFDTQVFDSVGVRETDEWLAISVVDGVVDGVEASTAVDALVAGVVDQFPHADVETADQFRDRIEGLIDDTLAMVNVMVALAVIIALIGIANTLALSVFERTKELGLVRAVGMTRRQLRRMVRFEAALVATFGAVLGVGVGILFGWGIVMALPDAMTSTMAIPVGSIAMVMGVAAIAGVVAAWLPARRAGRLDVLDAIAH
ncbi:MAG: FtsX-like permease family protein, partial [Acidimicrobiia bacterium]